MANDENTAVNDLIARVTGGPISPGSETLPASPRARLGLGSPRAADPRATYDDDPDALDDDLDPDGAEHAPSAIPPWVQSARDQQEDDGEHSVGTMRVQRSSNSQLIRKLALPMVLVALAGGLVGAFIALRGPRPAATAAATPSPSADSPSTDSPRPSASPRPNTDSPRPSASPSTDSPSADSPRASADSPRPSTDSPSSARVAPIADSPPPTTERLAPIADSPTADRRSPITDSPPPITDSPPPITVAATATGNRGNGVAAPVVVAPAPPAPSLIDVRIDSTPSGATVMLVDRGTTQLVGNTPIAAAIDPTRDYDLIFTYAGKPTKVAHLDPRLTQRIAVTLDGAAATTAAPRDPPAAAPAARRSATSSPSTSRKEPRAEPARGTGTLMISSKPPCEIVIDGKPTGLTTPQRAISLSAGRHKVTLLNADKDIQRTLSIQIAPNATEKVIEDLMP